MTTSRAAIALALLLLPLAAPAAVEASHVLGAPPNDDYLQSFELNRPGSRLERDATLQDPAPGMVRNTSSASVQPNIFSPDLNGGPGRPGPAEVTSCAGSSYGSTVWYDFHPDVPGTVRLRANGYNTALTVIPFDPQTGVPDYGRRFCANRDAGTTEESFAKVARGRAYTVQVGGVNGASGNLQFLFDFLADTDGDGIFDDVDVCDLREGKSETGCVAADATLRARPTGTGIEIGSLRVKAPRGFKVSVRCNGCRPQAKRAGTVGFSALRGRKLRAGTSLVIRVTKKHNIGAYFRYTVLRGNFKPKVERCLNPGSQQPRRRCSY